MNLGEFILRYLAQAEPKDVHFQWLLARLKCDTIKMILIDLEYDNVLGRLSETEQQLLKACLFNWARCHYPIARAKEIEEGKLSSTMKNLFLSRFEEKLDEKLSALSDMPDFQVEKPIKVKEEWSKTCRTVEHVSAMITETSAIYEDVFARRSDYQQKILFALGKALSREVNHLSCNLNVIESKIDSSLLNPSVKATNLQNTYEQLMTEKLNLEKRLTELTSLLNAYLQQEKHYIQLANQKADNQRHMTFLQHLKGKNERYSGQGGRRRSLSSDQSKQSSQKQAFIRANF